MEILGPCKSPRLCDRRKTPNRRSPWRTDKLCLRVNGIKSETWSHCGWWGLHSESGNWGLRRRHHQHMGNMGLGRVQAVSRWLHTRLDAKNFAVAAGPTGFVCVAGGTPTAPGAVTGGGSCTPNASGDCGGWSGNPVSTWKFWGRRDRSWWLRKRNRSSYGSFGQWNQNNRQPATLTTGFVCVIEGTPTHSGAIFGGGACAPNSVGDCGGWKGNPVALGSLGGTISQA